MNCPIYIIKILSRRRLSGTRIISEASLNRHPYVKVAESTYYVGTQRASVLSWTIAIGGTDEAQYTYTIYVHRLQQWRSQREAGQSC
jgi:hypothetical protein